MVTSPKFFHMFTTSLAVCCVNLGVALSNVALLGGECDIAFAVLIDWSGQKSAA